MLRHPPFDIVSDELIVLIAYHVICARDFFVHVDHMVVVLMLRMWVTWGSPSCCC